MDNKGLKEIAELAVLGCKRNPQAHTTQECMNCEFHPHSCNQWEHAEKAINAGYQKTQEDSIVLSKEEYDGLKKQVHALEHLATCYSEQIDWDNDARKETAKEILQQFWKIQWGQSELDNVCLRLAKRYGVEVEE